MSTQRTLNQPFQPLNSATRRPENARKKAFVKPMLERQESLPKITFGSNIFGDGGQQK